MTSNERNKEVFTCDGCDTEYPNAVVRHCTSFEGPRVCEGCFQDGVLDDININGDMASVNTSGVY